MKTLVVQSFVHSDFGNLKGYLDNNPDRNLVSSLMLSLFYCLYHQTKVKFTEEAVGRLQNFLQEEKDRRKTVPHFQHFTDRISKHKEHAFYIHESKNQRKKDIKQMAFLFPSGLSNIKSDQGLQAFFNELIFAPHKLEFKFLPSMPHDVTFEIIQLSKKDVDMTLNRQPKFFKCPNNHIYTFGNCTHRRT